LLGFPVREKRQDLIFGYASVVDHSDAASLAGSGQIPSNLSNTTRTLDYIARLRMIGQMLLKFSVSLIRH
jgi:hypothetical protein